jgi:RNA-directed DNA polymerase
MEGQMEETPSSQTISTKLQRIAEMAKAAPDMAFTTLAHHIDINWLREAYRRTRKDGATGVDGQTAADYAANLEENLRSLLNRAKSGTYRAPPVRRVHIPKGDGKQMRPIGIPTFEDKVLQRAVLMLLEAIYEQDFHDFSYGFRPGRSAHQALDALQSTLVKMAGGWVLEVDIKKFFDTMDHEHLREILRHRVRDGVLLRLIGKWLNAGVLEGLELSRPDAGTPQGGVISPLLANIYLHEVLDEWFVRAVKPRLRGRVHLFRYADDFVLVFNRESSARRVLAVLPKRLGRYGLTLHPDKTRLLNFQRPDKRDDDHNERGGSEDRTFDLLGFTHFWGKSPNGKWVVMKRTASDRFSRALRRMRTWIRVHRHDPVPAQHRALSQKLRGHYAYYGVMWNWQRLASFHWEVRRAWRKWLSRRSSAARRKCTWAWMRALLERLPLPPPRIVHRFGGSPAQVPT